LTKPSKCNVHRLIGSHEIPEKVAIANGRRTWVFSDEGGNRIQKGVRFSNPSAICFATSGISFRGEEYEANDSDIRTVRASILQRLSSISSTKPGQQVDRGSRLMTQVSGVFAQRRGDGICRCKWESNPVELWPTGQRSGGLVDVVAVVV
jgi:hypothetical protein